ncbi:hypothetical protein [Paenibacillus oleatilyticus]|uniref:hypothetical protein n=1 Tax=Paenibacillus oleatilyticus TaxID=2594886 RepID=UPI001C1F3249|nr:hypothetical protein [Paenibacillus oleatilyticus]MBU7319159.1 hypothetical protein [Paenibacillus oleatilyticus]
MELSYYFYTDFQTREEIDEFLLEQARKAVEDRADFKISRQEESEEGEGDTLDFICKSFCVSTNLSFVQDIAKEFDLDVNFRLLISVYPSGGAKFIQFIGNLLSGTTGDAILLDEHDIKVLERRRESVAVNNYYFDGDFSNLGLPYANGFYQKFVLQVAVSNMNSDVIQMLKPEIIHIANDCIDECKMNLIEDPDIRSEFGICWNDFKVDVQKRGKGINHVGQVISISGGHIYTDQHNPGLKVMMNFFKRVLERFEGDCELRIKEGYLIRDYREIVLLERTDGVITVNEKAKEKSLLDEVGLG